MDDNLGCDYSAAQKNLCIRLTQKHATVSDESRVYALSDTHGHEEVMESSLELITKDVATYPPSNNQKIVVATLGDLIDKGNSTRQVIERLLKFRLPAYFIDRRTLAGNHEELAINFANGPQNNLNNWASRSLQWIKAAGGTATLNSYGIDVPENLSFDPAEKTEKFLQEARNLLVPRLKQHGHMAYFQALLTTLSWRHVVFCHAQISPDKDAKDHGVHEVIRGREITKYDGGFYGNKIVVYGHSGRSSHAQLREESICIDPVVEKFNKPLVLAFDKKRGRVLEITGTRPLDTSYVRRHNGPTALAA